MAGICGSISGIKIDLIIEGIKHRGNAIASWQGDGISLGCVYNKSLRKKGIVVDNESVLVYDGAFYNVDENEIIEQLSENISFIQNIDGDFALAFYDGKNLLLSTDMVGTKPLWINKNSFASEKKAITDAVAVEPATVMSNFRVISRFGFKKKAPTKTNYNTLKSLIIKAVEKRTADIKKAGVLFSGGIDSTLLALLLSERIRIKCYTAGFYGAPDIEWSQIVADEMGFKLKVIEMDDVETLVKNVVKTIGTTNLMKVGVAMPLYACCKQCREDVIFSGVGSEEIFAGYERHINALKHGFHAMQHEMWKGIETMWERDLQRDDLVASYFSKELRAPFVDRYVIDEAMQIHPSLKYSNGLKKYVLRRIAQEIGVPEKVCKRPKKAAQYGSYAHKMIVKLAKRQGFEAHAYLKSLAL